MGNLEGRLAHIRIHGSQRAIDLVAVYQHAHSSRASEAKRASLWAALDSLLQRLPRRNNLVVAGDLNTTGADIPQLVGSLVYQWNGMKTQGSSHPDVGTLMDIMKRFSLVALNILNGGDPPMCTPTTRLGLTTSSSEPVMQMAHRSIPAPCQMPPS